MKADSVRNSEKSVSDIDKISALFGREPSVDQFQGALPSRTVYVRSFSDENTIQNLERGQNFCPNIAAHWAAKNTKVNFEQAGSDWVFALDKPAGEYFSISWALTSKEIERLQRNIQISVSYEDLKNSRGMPVKCKVQGRIIVLRGKFETVKLSRMTEISGRKTVGFQLDDPTLNYDKAHRVWIDLIFERPRVETLRLSGPILVLQRTIEL